MSVIDASSRFGRRMKSDTSCGVTTVRIVQSCPACDSYHFNVVIEVGPETPTLRCSSCNFEAGIFEFIELPG